MRKGHPMPRPTAKQGLREEGWAFLRRFPTLTGRLVLTHNRWLQRGADLAPGELEPALRALAEACREKENRRITGPVKVAERTRLNGAPLLVVLEREMHRQHHD